jgi:parallel beta-helix repeat protein
MVADPSRRRFPGRMTMSRGVARASLALAMTAAVVTVWAQPAQANPPCGASVTVNLVLTGNLICAGTALVVTADNVVIDLNGFTVSGNGTGDGILVLRSRVTIRNGTVQRFETGILLQGVGEGDSEDDLVSRVTARGNYSGIKLVNSDRSTITDSVLTANVYVGAELRVQSDRNRIVRTQVTANDVGVSINEGSDTNTVGESTFSKNTVGVLLTDGGDDNLVQSNTITGNLEGGVEIKGPGAGGNIVRANRITSNGVGVLMCCGGVLDGNQILGNSVLSNAASGILILVDLAPNTIVADNIARNNGFGAPLDPRDPGESDDGIHVDSVFQSLVTITHNAADQNADLGIEAAGQIVDGGGNTAVGNGNPAQCVGVVC